MLASLIAGAAAAAGRRPRSASAGRQRRVRADRARAGRACASRKARSAITTATTRCGTTIRCSTSQRLARRRDAIYPATVVGKPRQEDFFIGDLLQTLLSPLFPLVMPAVRQLWSYGETGYHSLAAAVVRERYRREAMASAFRILGEGQLSLTKFLLVTDRDVDLSDFTATLTHVLARTRPGDRSLRVLEPVDGHARLHRAVGQRRLEGRVARPRRSGARRCRRRSRRPTCRPGVRDVRVFCPRLPGRRRAAARRRSRTRRRGWRASPAFAAGRWSC